MNSIFGGPRRASRGNDFIRLMRQAGWAWALFGLALAIQAAPAFKVEVDRSPISIEETATLRLIFQDLTPPGRVDVKLPAGLEADFVSRSQNVQSINGETTSQVIYIYQITASQAGDYTIPGYQITIEGKKYTSSPLTFKVLPPNAPPPEGAAKRSEIAFIQLILTKSNLYVGESIPLEVRVYAQGFRNGNYPQVKAEGFMLGTNSQPQQDDTIFQGKRYHYFIFRQPATAMSAGVTQLGPASIQIICTVPTGRVTRDFFMGNIPEMEERRLNLASDAAPIQVLPLPTEGVPASFHGAVGTYTMSVTAGPTNVAAGDPITVKIELTGSGSINTLDFPSLDLGSEFKVYPPVIKSQVADGIGLQGSKTFEYVVVPQSPDLRQIPAFDFSFFDPDKKAYQTLRQPAKDIIVRPGGSAAPPPSLAGVETKKTEPAQDIANIKARPGKLGPPARPLAMETWFLGWQLLPLLGIGAALGRRLYQRHKQRNPQWVRQREVGRWVDKALAELQSLAGSGNAEAFYATVFRVLQEQLGERLERPAQAITDAVIEEALRPRGLDEESITRLRALFARCDQARYAQVSSNSDLMDTLAELNAIIPVLREFTPKRGPNPLRAAVPLFLWVLLSLPAQAANEFEQGNAAYAEGKLNAAITNYEALVKQKQVSPALYFNLGNAYFKMGQLGQAIAHYRLAQELAPRDTDIANNLQMARTRANASAPYRTPWWRSWTQLLTVNEWTLAAMAAGWVLAGLIIARLWRANATPLVSKGIRIFISLLLITGAGLTARLWDYLGPAPAVVVAKDAPARYGPLEESRSAFVMPDGSEVQAVDFQNDWVQIRDPQGRTGWLKKEFVRILKGT